MVASRPGPAGILAAVLFLAAATSDATDFTSLIASARPSVVFLSTAVLLPGGQTATHLGTGFVISPQGYVLTAGHVIPTKSEGQLGRIMGAKQSSAATPEELELVARDPLFDAALLRFKNTAATYVPLKLVSHASVQPGNEIFQVGFPGGLEFNSKTGRVSGLGGPYGSLISDLVLNPGDSGGPILTTSTEAIAIVVSDLANAQGISFLLPVTHASSLLAIAGVAVSSAKAAAPDLSYRVVGEITGSFEASEDWSNTFNYSKSDQNCEASYDATQKFCAPAGFLVKSPGQVSPHSANCNSSIGSSRIVSSNCVEVPAHVGGCGYDRVLSQIVNCKGRGWVDYSITLTANKPMATPFESYPFDLSSMDGAKSTFTATHPKAIAKLPGRQWKYKVRVMALQGGNTVRTMNADTESPWPEGLATRMDDGVLQISILK